MYIRSAFSPAVHPVQIAWVAGVGETGDGRVRGQQLGRVGRAAEAEQAPGLQEHHPGRGLGARAYPPRSPAPLYIAHHFMAPS